MLRGKTSEAPLNSDGTPEFILPIVSAGRLLMPEEIARMVTFCSSNASVNGGVFHVNLGQKQLWCVVLVVCLRQKCPHKLYRHVQIDAGMINAAPIVFHGNCFMCALLINSSKRSPRMVCINIEAKGDGVGGMMMVLVAP